SAVRLEMINRSIGSKPEKSFGAAHGAAGPRAVQTATTTVGAHQRQAPVARSISHPRNSATIIPATTVSRETLARRYQPLEATPGMPTITGNTTAMMRRIVVEERSGPTSRTKTGCAVGAQGSTRQRMMPARDGSSKAHHETVGAPGSLDVAAPSGRATATMTKEPMASAMPMATIVRPLVLVQGELGMRGVEEVNWSSIRRFSSAVDEQRLGHISRAGNATPLPS